MVMAQTINKNQPYLDLDDKFVNQVLMRSARIVAHRAQGSYIYDLNGQAYLDFTTGIAVNNVGHCHPKVVEAVQKQVAQLMHTSVVTHHERYIELCQKLVEIAPHPSLNSVFLTNSGAEAVEGAIKMARYITKRPAVINFRGSFHGRTLMATALTTSKLYYREGYEPLPTSIYTVPYAYQYRSNHRDNAQACVDEALSHFDTLFSQFVSPSQVASIIVEPVQGEGGYIVPPPGFLAGLRKIADQHGILLIVDEVQSGFGRTGSMFAIEQSKVAPDIMLMAKGIAGGMPLAAFISRKELTDQWKPGRHGSTFGGNPVSCAAALATIGVLQEEKLPERAKALGAKIMERFKKFASGKQHIGEVRGAGLMIGVEFNDKDGNPSKEIAEKVAERCFAKNLLVLTCGNYGQVIRLIPPLNLSDEDAEKGLQILEEAMTL